VARQSQAIARELERHVESIQAEFARRLVVKLKAATPIDPSYPADDRRHARNRWVAVAIGSAIVVGNDAGHIMELNDGDSKQAPAGFIERCLDEVTLEMQIEVRRGTRVQFTSGEVFEYQP
jgi:hypothetical protein